MKPVSRSATVALLSGLLVVGACANSEVGGPTPGSGGNSSPGSAGSGSPGSAGSGSPGSGGSSSPGSAGNGSPGSGGSSSPGSAGSGSPGSAGSGSPGAGGTGTPGAGGTGTPGAGGSGGTGTPGAGGATGTAGAMGTAGTTGMAGRGGSGNAGRGGSGTGTAGRGGNGTAGTTGTGGTSSMTGMGGTMSTTALDCGPQGYIVENHGPASNRLNYVILGDGFQTADLGAGGVFEKDLANVMTRRFSANATPFNRYRNFINICGIKLVSTAAICSGNSQLACCGDDNSRLANCNMTSVNAAFNALPKTLTIDWRAVMLNGSSWWNSGGTTMLFSGGNSDAPGAALHEGGHGFQQLADEYGTCTGGGCGTNTMGSGTKGTVNPEVNSCGDPSTTDNKWTMWIGYNQAGATGVQGTWDGSRYIAIGAGQYRPSANSMMNSLFCGQGGNANCTANTAYNSVSREETVMAIWKRIKPIDSTEPAAGAVTSPGVLKVNVIDSNVISVDWTVDGTTTVNGGIMFDTSSLGAGSHTVSAKAYDNAGDDLVRVKTSTCPSSVTGSYCHYTAWKNSIQTVTWTFTK